MSANASKDLEPLYLFDDEPAERLANSGEDHLHADSLHVDTFARVVAGAALGARGPFNIGVFANWGLGKTSVLKLAQKLIDNGNRENAGADGHDAITVWVNAWKYEHDTHPIIPLIASIVDAIEQKQEQLKIEQDGETITNVKKFCTNASRGLRAFAYSANAKAKIGIPGGAEIEAGFVVEKMVERYEELGRTRDPLLDQSIFYKADTILNNLYDGFGKEIKQASRPKIIVFIDDLDRCLPDKALKLLESIKLVLAHPGFIFILAVDREVIDSFLQKLYADEYGMKDYAKKGGGHYLDKLIQLPLHVPRHQDNFEKHIESLILAYARHNYGIAHPDNLKNDEPWLYALLGLAPALTAGTEANPRSLIRLLNRLLTDRFMWDIHRDEEEHNNTDDWKKGIVLPTNEFLQIAAVSRMLEDRMYREVYHHLVDDRSDRMKLLRDMLRDQHSNEMPLSDLLPSYTASMDDRQKKERLREQAERMDIGEEQKDYYEQYENDYWNKQYCAELDNYPFLKAMLKTEEGQYWLDNPEKRQQAEKQLIITSQSEPEKETEPARKSIVSAEEYKNVVSDKKKSLVLRLHLVRALASHFKEVEWVSGYLKELAEDPKEDVAIRRKAVRELAAHYRKEPWLLGWLKELAEDRKWDASVRSQAIKSLVEYYSEEDWVLGLLKKLAKDSNEKAHVRKSAAVSLDKYYYDEPDVHELVNLVLSELNEEEKACEHNKRQGGLAEDGRIFIDDGPFPEA